MRKWFDSIIPIFRDILTDRLFLKLPRLEGESSMLKRVFHRLLITFNPYVDGGVKGWESNHNPKAFDVPTACATKTGIETQTGERFNFWGGSSFYRELRRNKVISWRGTIYLGFERYHIDIWGIALFKLFFNPIFDMLFNHVVNKCTVSPQF